MCEGGKIVQVKRIRIGIRTSERSDFAILGASTRFACFSVISSNWSSIFLVHLSHCGHGIGDDDDDG